MFLLFSYAQGVECGRAGVEVFLLGGGAMRGPGDKSYEALPSFADGMPKGEQQLIARPPESLMDRLESFVHSREFPIIAFIVVAILFLKRR